MAFGVCTSCFPPSFPPSTGQKWKILQKRFDIVTTHNDKISYVKHVSDPLCVFFTLFGCWGGVPRGLGHNLLMQFYSLGSSKMEKLKLIFLIL